MTAKWNKNDRVRYTSWIGADYSARVLTAHRDGSYTVEVRFPLIDGKDVPAFQGDKVRVWDNQLSSVWVA